MRCQNEGPSKVSGQKRKQKGTQKQLQKILSGPHNWAASETRACWGKNVDALKFYLYMVNI